jgi:hypothetical protein
VYKVIRAKIMDIQTLITYIIQYRKPLSSCVYRLSKTHQKAYLSYFDDIT